MINELIKAIETMNKNVVYGMILDTTECIKNDDWNFFVVNKDVMKKSKYGFKQYICVTFVSEGYIQDGYEMEIIKNIEKHTSLKLSSDDSMSYAYTRKGKTDEVVEACTITFLQDYCAEC